MKTPKMTYPQNAANRYQNREGRSKGKGLYLEVRPNGSKYWGYKYRFVGEEKLQALGVYPETSLAEARGSTSKRANCRRLALILPRIKKRTQTKEMMRVYNKVPATRSWLIKVMFAQHNDVLYFT